jgi:hypothetical protein
MATRIVILLTFEKAGGWFTRPSYTIKVLDADLRTFGVMSRTTVTFRYWSKEEFTTALESLEGKLREDSTCQFMRILRADA